MLHYANARALQRSERPVEDEPVTEALAWPLKTRELQNHHMDSTIWNDFPFRDDDIVVATYAKAGTTWMQQIVGQLLFRGDPTVKPMQICPWLDMRIAQDEKLAQLAAQTHRRFIKTHLPADALVMSPKARYIYVARDGRDVVWSFYNHHASHTPQFYERINETPGRVGPPFERPPADIRQYWRDWLDRDGYPYWSFWESVRSWWVLRGLPNVLLVHYANLKRDLAAEIRRVADFLDVPIDDACWEAILEHCSFAWMKANAETLLPGAETSFEGGATTFIHRGVNGRWSEALTPAEIAEYEARAVQELGPECARWLATGDPR
jgi:aryl sulfotransferase